MKKQLYLLALIGAFSSTNKLSAQDIHFSQFFSSPLVYSPANTGNFDGDWRVSANYRSQWKQIAKPYTTQSLGYDQQIYVFNEQFSAGGLIINDNSGGTLNVLKFLLSAAYHKNINGHKLHGGLQFGYVNKQLSYINETFPSQLNWGKGYFDPTMPNNESTLNGNFGFMDLNAGLGWDKKFNKLTPYLGVSFYHLNYPKESFLNNENILKPRTVATGGVRWQLGKKIALAPNLLYVTTTKASEFLGGTNVEYALGTNAAKVKSVYLGGYARGGFNRNVDAAFAVIGINFLNYNVGVSYDFNISDLHISTNYRGAFEASFIYTGLSTRLTKTAIPCERY